GRQAVCRRHRRTHRVAAGLPRRHRQGDGGGNARRRRAVRLHGRLVIRRNGGGIMLRALLAGLAAGAVLIGAAPADQPAPLRLCADPSNLPFSSSSEAAAKAGLYVEIGQAVASALGRPMETVWSLSYFEKRNLRATMLAGRCDFTVG